MIHVIGHTKEASNKEIDRRSYICSALNQIKTANKLGITNDRIFIIYSEKGRFISFPFFIMECKISLASYRDVPIPFQFFVGFDRCVFFPTPDLLRIGEGLHQQNVQPQN